MEEEENAKSLVINIHTHIYFFLFLLEEFFPIMFSLRSFPSFKLAFHKPCLSSLWSVFCLIHSLVFWCWLPGSMHGVTLGSVFIVHSDATTFSQSDLQVEVIQIKASHSILVCHVSGYCFCVCVDVLELSPIEPLSSDSSILGISWRNKCCLSSSFFIKSK